MAPDVEEARVRRRINYSNVMASVAVFLVLGGGAYAALSVPKNSITSKQIKKGSIKRSDLAKSSVGKKQLKNNAVNGSKVADDSLTGADIDESTLGAVSNSERVGGSRVEQISYSAGPNTSAETLFSIAGLTVSAQCPPALDDHVILTATTDTNDSIIGLPESINGSGVGVDNDFDAGELQGLTIDDTTAVLSYGRGPDSSSILTASFLANQFVGGGGTCRVVGTVVTDG